LRECVSDIRKVAMAISAHHRGAIFYRYNFTIERDLTDAARKLDAYLQNGHISGAIQVPDEIPAKSAPRLTHVNFWCPGWGSNPHVL
jgi:hypothetical protein